jgi:hypothetical protein
MKIASLKSLLDSFDDNDELAVAISIYGKDEAVVTYDVGFGKDEFGKFMLEVAVCEGELVTKQ